MFCLYLIFLSLSLHLSESRSTESDSVDRHFCSRVCGAEHNLDIPKCDGNISKVVPNYHESCGCLLNYQCCPKKCPNATTVCKKDVEFYEAVKDSCNCFIPRCAPCPKSPTSCNRCQMLKKSKDSLTGCASLKCTSICTDASKTYCPSCYQLETIFDHNCNCTIGHCIPKPCHENTEISPEKCKSVSVEKDACGCEIYTQDERAFCNESNRHAAAYECPDKCHRKQIMKDECGCDEAKCVPKNGAEEKCSHNFAKETRCPSGTFLSSGLSVCGNERHICLQCPEKDKAKETCNTKCSFEKKTKDIVTGCLSYECVRKRCPEIKIPPCRSALGLEIKRDSCDCARIVCAKPKVADEFSFHSNLQNWTEAQRLCESLNGRLAIIADSIKQEWIGKSVGPFDHWVGARCRKYFAFSSFFWIFPNGTRLPFLEPQGRENYTEVCDGEEAGIVFSSTGFEDETLEKLRPFICQYSR